MGSTVKCTDIADQLIACVTALDLEARQVYSAVVLPAWDSQPHRYPVTLYGLIMACFSIIDLASQYCEGRTGNATHRICSFMDQYISSNREANDVAIQMWRHSLMHTGKPRVLCDTRTSVRYNWLLHWSPEKLAPLTHFSFQNDGQCKTLNLTLLELILAVKTGLESYVHDLSTDLKLQRNCIKVHPQVELQRFRTRR